MPFLPAYKILLFHCPFPCISTAVAAPIVPPLVIYILSHDIDINAPAEIARRFINATVSIGESNIASFICVAASTRPPKVSISNITATAPSAAAAFEGVQ